MILSSLKSNTGIPGEPQLKGGDIDQIKSKGETK